MVSALIEIEEVKKLLTNLSEWKETVDVKLTRIELMVGALANARLFDVDRFANSASKIKPSEKHQIVLGTKIRKARMAKNLKISELCRMLRTRGQKLSPSYLSMIELGKRDPRTSLMQQIAVVLEKPLSYFSSER